MLRVDDCWRCRWRSRRRSWSCRSSARVLTGSLALLADAAHMFTDAAALVIALIASVVAARPANDRRTFGYQRAEVFGALINAVMLIVLAVWVAVEARRASADAERGGGRRVADARRSPSSGSSRTPSRMWLLSRAQRTSINVRGAYLEVMGDLLGSGAGHRGGDRDRAHGMDAGGCDRVAADRRHDRAASHRAAARGRSRCSRSRRRRERR